MDATAILASFFFLLPFIALGKLISGDKDRAAQVEINNRRFRNGIQCLKCPLTKEHNLQVYFENRRGQKGQWQKMQ